MAPRPNAAKPDSVCSIQIGAFVVVDDPVAFAREDVQWIFGMPSQAMLDMIEQTRLAAGEKETLHVVSRPFCRAFETPREKGEWLCLNR